jgi:predicted HAD superfamily Cof-like phosphohydrolase
MTHEEAVRQFHEKHGFPSAELGPGLENSQSLLSIARHTKHFAEAIEQIATLLQLAGDPRLYRLHLILEEISELATGLHKGDKTEVADAIGDLLYVIYGTAVTYNLPADKIFWEVHRSNMTKSVRNPEDPRMRSKGPEYSPPDFKEIL